MRKPYYDHNGITIYHGDCLEILPELPDNSIDIIVTDPPYGLNYNDGDMASLWEAIFNGDKSRMKPNPIKNDDEETAYFLFEEMLKHAKRLLQGGCCCCCCGGGPKLLFANWTLLMDKYLKFKQAIVWDKGWLGMGLHYRRSYEFMLVAQEPNGKCIWNGGNSQSNVVKIKKIIPSEKQHPTEKPWELMGKFIELHSDIDNLVLDPFMGHGSTLFAAKQLKRKAIGIEIEEKYCEIAAKRLSQEVLTF